MAETKTTHPPVNSVNTEGPWSVLQGVNNGFKMILRLNTGLAPLIGHPDYSNQVGIAVRLNDADELRDA